MMEHGGTCSARLGWERLGGEAPGDPQGAWNLCDFKLQEFFLHIITFHLLDAISCTLTSFLFNCLFFVNITWFYHREARRKQDDMLGSL